MAGKIPVWGIVAVLLLVAAGALALTLLGPPSAPVLQHSGQMVAAIVGMPSELLYGNMFDGTLFPWTVGIAQNSYQNARTNVVPTISVTASVALTNCSQIVVQESTTAEGTYTTLVATFSSGTCTYQGASATYGLMVGGGSLAETWYFKSAIGDPSAPGTGKTYTWYAQFTGE
jgi:hypothetical protein